MTYWITSILVTLVVFCSKSFATLELNTYFSQHGIHGEIKFIYLQQNHIKLITNLQTTLEHPTQIWSWGVYEFPVDYRDLGNRCTDEKLGKMLFSFDENHGYLNMPENKSSEIIIRDGLAITGDTGIYGKSLVLKSTENEQIRACSSITIVNKFDEKVAVAKFNTPVFGSVYFRWIATKDNHIDTLIQTDLYQVSYNDTDKRIPYSEHGWKIYVTDILDADNDKSELNCNVLQLVFDPNNKGSQHAVGDVDSRLGKLKISTDYTRNKYKTLFRDGDLLFLPSDLNGPQRRLYLVIFDEKHPESFLTCAKIRHHNPINAKAIIQSGDMKGDISFVQNSPFDPTFVSVNLVPARDDLESKLIYGSKVGGYKIHELPPIPAKTIEQADQTCLTTKSIYNPTNINENVPPSGFGTQDQYKIGDLSGKLLNRNNATDLIPGSLELRGLYWDVFLPLEGINSIVHRSVVIYENIEKPNENVTRIPWICGNIVLYTQNFKYQMPIFTAQVIFRYPIIGKIVFRQMKDNPYTDTTIVVETLVHADGAQISDTGEHRWAVHDLAPGKDFYNWTGRCLSAGGVYNPYKVAINEKNPTDKCEMSTIGLCRLGDLSSRLGMLKIAGKNADGSKVSRQLYTDINLPLNGLKSIMGKSIVIYDDHGPVARGERLACSVVGGVYRRKAVVKDWYGNGDPLTVTGKIEFFQQTEYDITNVEVSLEGLMENSGYHIHMTPVESHLEFPCEKTTLYDHWNPLNVDPNKSPRLYQGTSDKYEMGDLSGKFGTLDDHKTYKTYYNDTMLPLFGPRSILGRSVIIHKKRKNRRWVCSTIERGYSPSEAREIRAIVSFHHPAGFAYGYIRMSQLVYNDNSKSDTIIEVKLRHPGQNDRNITRDHNWAVFVNPVGVDAAVKTYGTRCVAGGYVWNPYYTQLADPLNEDLYRQECGPDNPLRCHVGDLSARLGTIDIGLKRQVFTDQNLPLEGDVSAVGKSIVIKSPNRGSFNFACANIEPDHDIIKYANIEKPPRFVLALFLGEVRNILGVPEWMLSVDSRKTKILHNGGCIQFLLHFRGPIAHKLEQDFTRLVASGRLDTPSLYVPGYYDTKRKATLSYKQCGSTDPNEKRPRRRFSFSSNARIINMDLSTIFVSLLLLKYGRILL